jgi:hypothetical protein
MINRVPMLGPLSWLITAGCTPQADDLWIEPGSTADHVVFGIGKTRVGPPVDQFGVLRVYACEGAQIGEGAMWVLSQEEEGPGSPARRLR